MKLYLVRHATASDLAPSDAERPLTKEGRQEAQIAGAALGRLEVRPDQILSSPLLRARQTAEIIAEKLKFQKEISVFPELGNGHTLAQVLRVAKTFEPFTEMIWVGHMPSLAEHLAGLLGSEHPAALSMGKATVACVELTTLRAGRAELRWFMRQKQLRLVAS
ncbi:MAG: phosphohistidine phosphatase SixA [Verrucomicrobiae bacterium]|nr:phosphohistidine phosphatase SixA [Verrucomicrobiae bacterium]